MMGVFLRLFTSTFTKESNYNPRFCEKSQLTNEEYLTNIKIIKIIKCSQSIHTVTLTESQATEPESPVSI